MIIYISISKIIIFIINLFAFMNKLIHLSHVILICFHILHLNAYKYNVDIKTNKKFCLQKFSYNYNYNRNTDKESVTKLFSNLDTNNGFNKFQNHLESKYKWLFSYADLAPYSTSSIEGLVFLATNLFYSYVGIVLFQNNQSFYSLVIEIAGVVSMYYHWCQLNYGPNNQQVIKALILDYFIACSTIILITYYAFQFYSITTIVPFSCISLALVALSSLGLSWKYEYGLPYMMYHGLWHILSAYAVQELFFISQII